LIAHRNHTMAGNEFQLASSKGFPLRLLRESGTLH
jgi:hypothetical protein